MPRAADLKAELEWLRPAVNRLGARPRYGVSSCQLIRHCIWDEPLRRWEAPHDHWDLLGSTATALDAPEHLRAKAQAVIVQYREWLEPRYVLMADNKAVQEAYAEDSGRIVLQAKQRGTANKAPLGES